MHIYWSIAQSISWDSSMIFWVTVTIGVYWIVFSGDSRWSSVAKHYYFIYSAFISKVLYSKYFFSSWILICLLTFLYFYWTLSYLILVIFERKSCSLAWELPPYNFFSFSLKCIKTYWILKVDLLLAGSPLLSSVAYFLVIWSFMLIDTASVIFKLLFLIFI